ncbi:MAG TPA: class I SAM-dependent methyltransferase, partial [Actinomycetota bacterium]|nr:class I SAM-dependent methyltransferase [Actinomycetota bacterium]
HAAQLGRRTAAWGVWAIPESRVRVLGDVRDSVVLELGCGGGQWSRWLARMGARPVGLDLSIRQLEHAARSVRRARRPVPFVAGDAERLPFGDERFDVVMCDHGAMTFADPRRTVPEVARVLRPGGLFAFGHASPFQFVCWDDAKDRVTERLARDYFDMRPWDQETVDFMLPYGEWIRLFRGNGLEVEDLIEPRPAAGARTTYPWFAPLRWARRFPSENIWKLRKRPA